MEMELAVEIKLKSEKLNPFQAEEFASDDDPSSRALPETEALWYLSVASKEHRALLKHPVIASFLWLKWQRIRDATQWTHGSNFIVGVYRVG